VGRAHDAAVWAYTRLASCAICIVSFLFSVVLFQYVVSPVKVAGEGGGGGLLDRVRLELQRTGWVKTVRRLARATGGVENAIQKSFSCLTRDMAFPFAYVVLCISSVALLTKDGDKQPSTWVLVLFLLPVLAGAFDWAENLMRMHLLRGVKVPGDLNALPDHLLSLSHAFTLVKWLLVIGPPLVALLAKLTRVL
jgi:hypothetical protein